MCTAITMQTSQSENFFGRTMDFSHPIEPALYVVPRQYEWRSLISDQTYVDRYSFISIGQQADHMLGFFDGVNEKGLAAAVLYFEGYADYNLPQTGKEALASLDVLHYILGRCGSVEDVKSALHGVRIIGIPDPVTQRAAPLHWIATDRSGRSIAIEQTAQGLQIIDNPIGVLANSPDVHWHLTNLRNYLGVSVTQGQQAQWGDVTLTPFSQGAGTMLLPGGFSSPERFVRAAFLKTHVPIPSHRTEAVLTCFNIMNSVTIPKGIVITNRGTDDYTKYTAFMNTATGEYFFKTYENHQIRRARLSDYAWQGKQLLCLGELLT